MKKGDMFEGIIEKVEFPNKGIMMAGEERLVIKNAIPGQKVRAVVTKRRKGKSEGLALEILEKAPAERTEGVCPHFTQCGGCVYQSLPYEEQLAIKEGQVKELLNSVCPEGSFEWQGLKPSPISDGYRNKMEFSFGDEYKGGPLALGMHRRGSFYDIVTTGECQIVHPDFCKILTATKEYFEAHQVPFHKKMQHTGYLRHLLVRRAVKTGEILVDLVTTTQLDWMGCDAGIRVELGLESEKEDSVKVVLESEKEDSAKAVLESEKEDSAKAGLESEIEGSTKNGFEIRINGGAKGDSESNAAGSRQQEEPTPVGAAGFDKAAWKEAEERLLAGWRDMICGLPLEGKLAGVLHTQNDSLADVVQNDHTDILFGKDFFYEELLGLRFQITPFSFFQTNSLGAEVLYETTRSYIGETKDKVVFDLYSGTGTIAQILAPVASKVVGVEIVPEAVEAAKENAAMNGLENCEFWAGDVLKVIDELEDKPDLIVLDPPRDGIHPKALPKIIDFQVDRIVYVSCKITSLVRDLVLLQESGYRVVKACAVDMFPHTTGIETVVLLSKLNVNHHIEVELKMDELDLTAAESKATYDEIKAYVLEKFSLKVSQLYIAQIKRKCGIIERKNYNQSKKEDAKVPKCPPEKEAAIMEALKHFQMIP